MLKITGPLPPVPQAMSLIAKLSSEAFAKLKQAVNSPLAFDTSGERLGKIANDLDLSNRSDAFVIISSLDFLYSQIGYDPVSLEDTKAKLTNFASDTGLASLANDNAGKSLSRIAEMFYGNNSAEIYHKRWWLSKGILPNFLSVNSFVDLRPNFSKERTEIAEFIISTIFSIEIESQNNEDSTFAMQISESGLKRLQECISDALKKIDLLKRQPFVSDKLAPDRE